MDCFYEGENMLVIHPDECIDCGVCEPECPVDAIKPDTEPGLEKWLEINAQYAQVWPNITIKTRAAARCQGLGGQARQGRAIFAKSWQRRLSRDNDDGNRQLERLDANETLLAGEWRAMRDRA